MKKTIQKLVWIIPIVMILVLIKVSAYNLVDDTKIYKDVYKKPNPISGKNQIKI